MKNTGIIAAAFLILSGCSIEAGIFDLSSKVLPVTNGQLSGFVSSSAQNEKTTAGYKVQSSTGAFTNKIEETTQSGYKVYISVQGNIVSGQ
jgi:hypothetical protein